MEYVIKTQLKFTLPIHFSYKCRINKVVILLELFYKAVLNCILLFLSFVFHGHLNSVTYLLILGQKLSSEVQESE